MRIAGRSWPVSSRAKKKTRPLPPCGNAGSARWAGSGWRWEQAMESSDDAVMARARRAYEQGRIVAALRWLLVFPLLLAAGTWGCSGESVALCGASVITLGCLVAAWW